MYHVAFTKETDKSDSISLYHQLQLLCPGDTMLLGSYYLPYALFQGGIKVKCPITWQLLDKKGDRLLLLSRNVLYQSIYNDSKVMHTTPKTTWEESIIRAELNKKYFRTWFSAREQAIIIETVQAMDVNPIYKTCSGNDTTDRLFLLSLEEANKYLGVRLGYKKKQIGENVLPMAASCMIAADSFREPEGTETLFSPVHLSWWLRTAGMDTSHVACIDGDGYADFEGRASDASGVGVRPAMWIDISRLCTEKSEITDGGRNDDIYHGRHAFGFSPVQPACFSGAE